MSETENVFGAVQQPSFNDDEYGLCSIRFAQMNICEAKTTEEEEKVGRAHTDRYSAMQ